MAAPKQDVEEWIKEGKKRGAKWIISVCDTFDYEDYPVYIMPKNNIEDNKKLYDGVNMQRINEVIEIKPKKVAVKKLTVIRTEKFEKDLIEVAKQMKKHNDKKTKEDWKKSCENSQDKIFELLQSIRNACDILTQTNDAYAQEAYRILFKSHRDAIIVNRPLTKKEIAYGQSQYKLAVELTKARDKKYGFKS